MESHFRDSYVFGTHLRQPGPHYRYQMRTARHIARRVHHLSRSRPGLVGLRMLRGDAGIVLLWRFSVERGRGYLFLVLGVVTKGCCESVVPIDVDMASTVIYTADGLSIHPKLSKQRTAARQTMKPSRPKTLLEQSTFSALRSHQIEQKPLISSTTMRQ